MIKLANFTLHNQVAYIDKWREFGFEMDPTPRAPLIKFEEQEWTEDKILDSVKRAPRRSSKKGSKPS